MKDDIYEIANNKVILVNLRALTGKSLELFFFSFFFPKNILIKPVLIPYKNGFLSLILVSFIYCLFLFICGCMCVVLCVWRHPAITNSVDPDQLASDLQCLSCSMWIYISNTGQVV